jgi:ABC-2 type transport system permease protein
MLATVATKTIRDRWIGVAIGVGSMALLLLGGMAVYRDLDLSIYTDLPEAFRSIIGITEENDGFAAGEPEEPHARARLQSGGDGCTHCRGALTLHIFIHALFYGFMAMAIGAWTGKNGLASGATAGFMVVSMIAVGLLPLVGGLEEAARAFPWYYYDNGDPLLNGIDWGGLAVLIAAVLGFAVVALVGVNRRDLRDRNVAVTLADRLRANPMTQKIMNRLAGSARVSRIWMKTASEHQGLMIVVAYVLLLLGVMLGPMYTAIDSTLADLGDDFPEAILAIAGGGDLSSAEGWYQVEHFGLMVPIGVMVMTITIGARALAGEEARRTMGLLLANPISRSRVLLEKTLTMLLYAVTAGVVTFAGVAVGSMIAGLGLNMVNVAATSLLGTLLGLMFGAMALALSAATGRVKVAIFGAVGAALGFHVVASFLSINDSYAGWARWTPNYYYLGSDPLVSGMHWGHGALLAALTVGFIALSLVLFQRRDLRQIG